MMILVLGREAGDKGGNCVSAFSYRRIISPGRAFLCCRPVLVASLRHRQERKKGKKGRGGVLRKWQWMSHANSDGTERWRQIERQLPIYHHLLLLLLCMRGWTKTAELSLNSQQFMSSGDTWTWKYDSRAALAPTRTSVYMHIDTRRCKYMHITSLAYMKSQCFQCWLRQIRICN